jgi:hypothetical protein
MAAAFPRLPGVAIMRTRAYRPEVPGCLENRSLLSGVAALSPDPVILRRTKFNLVAEHIRMGFEFFSRDRVDSEVRDEVHNVIVLIPFGRVDGLGVSINNIVDRMEYEVSANVPHAVRSALHEVLAVIRADVKARVQAGDVVVR